MSALLQDLRYGLRLLAKSPWLTCVAVASLAIGIGVNSTAFSVIDAMFLRPPSGRNPNELVSVFANTPQGGDASSYPEYLDLNQDAAAFSGVLASSRHMSFLTTAHGTELVQIEVVSNNYFSVLGLNLAAGRTFTANAGGNSDNERVTIISYSLWRSRFGGDRSIIGHSIILNRSMYTVIGVAPKGFRGLATLIACDIWLPAGTEWSDSDLHNRKFRDFDLTARLAPKVTTEQARAELDVLAARLAKQYPATNANRTFELVSESERSRKGLTLTVLVMPIVSLVLLVCCANVAGLLIARSETRAREIAVRRALGAGRLRLIRQLLTEGLLLALGGGAVGLLLARWLIALQPALMPPFLTSIGADLRVDGRVWLFTFGTVLAAVLFFGLVPALVASRADLMEVLKGAAVGSASRRRLARNAFAAGEIAISFVLLVGAALFARSYFFSQTIHPGFDTRKNLLLVMLTPGMAGYNDSQILPYFQEVKGKVAETPGVARTSLARRFVLSEFGGGADVEVAKPGVPAESAQGNPRVKFNAVDSDYFRTVGTRILRGREFSAGEVDADSRVAIISQEMERRFWRDGDAIGRHILINGGDFEVVGVSQDARINGIHEQIEPYLYLPFSELLMDQPVLIIETRGNPLRIAGTIEKQIRSVNQNVPIIDMQTNRTFMRGVLWADRTEAEIVGVLSLLGILLAAVGLHGVISQIVNRRRRELGVRLALGAQRTDIFRLVIGEAGRLTVLGGMIGIGASLATTRFLANLLFGVRPYDLVSFIAACALLILIVPSASFYPAMRATRVDPADVLRSE